MVFWVEGVLVASEVGVLDRPGAVKAGPRRRRGCQLTECDAAALRWVGEQYGVRADVLGVLLGRLGGGGGPVSPRTVRWRVGRWERMRLARVVHVLGGSWVSLTRGGLDLADLGSLSPWKFPAPRLAHVHAVNVVRLAWEAGDAAAGGAVWGAERLLWGERGKADWHVPDAVVTDPAWGVSALEVELHRKAKVAYRDEVFGRLRAPAAGGPRFVRYLVPDEKFRVRLAGVLAGAVPDGCGVGWGVQVLPPVDGVAYMGRWQ